MEQERHNVVAEMIKLPLKLYENTTTLLLSEAAYEGEDDYDGNETGSDVSDSEEDVQNSPKVPKVPNPVDKRLAVDIDLALSPWSNARQYYEQRFVLLQPSIPLFKPIESPETLSRDSRAPPECIVLTLRNATGGLQP